MVQVAWYEQSYVVEILGSVITSLLFFIFFLIFRPKIKISPNICRFSTSNDEKFLIKFYNESYFFRIIDVKVQLRLVESLQAPGGKNLRIKYLKLKSNETLYIDRRNFKKDIYGKHALILTIEDNLDTIWNNPDSQYLEFIVSAKNSLTNIQRIKKEPYNDKNTVIKPGKFKIGSDTTIVSVHNP